MLKSRCTLKENLPLMNPVWSGEMICGSMDSRRVSRTLAKILPFFNSKEIAPCAMFLVNCLTQMTHYTYSIIPVPTLQKIAYKIPQETRQGQGFC